jgi:hypothetical protein
MALVQMLKVQMQHLDPVALRIFVSRCAASYFLVQRVAYNLQPRALRGIFQSPADIVDNESPETGAISLDEC